MNGRDVVVVEAFVVIGGGRHQISGDGAFIAKPECRQVDAGIEIRL